MNPAATAPTASSTTVRRNRTLAWTAIVTFSVLWFALLGQRPLYDPDEGRYAEIPREMLSGGDWVIPHLDGLVYLEKPPLQYWLSATMFRLFGESEFVARLPAGLAGYSSLAIVLFVGRRLWGYRAAFKAVLYTGASLLFVLLGHQLTLDMVLSLFLLASLACFLMAEREHAAARGVAGRARAWMLGCWAAMALSVLTKGLIGVLIPAATLLVYVAWQRDVRLLRRLQFAWGLPLFCLIAVPWFVMAARANAAFLRFFFVREHFQRFLTPIEHRSEPWWFFVPVLIVGVLPWLPQALRALSLPWRPAARRAFAPARILWAWCAFVLVFFSCSDAKLIPYILPAVPALALLCAAPQASADADSETRHDLLMGSLLTLIAVIGILAYASAQWSTVHARPLALELAPLLTVTAALLAAAAIACLLLTRRSRYDAALAVLCVGWFLGSHTVLEAAKGAQRFFSTKDAALLLRSRAPASAPIFAVQTYEQSLPFYLQRAVLLVDYRDEFELGLTQDSAVGIASLNQFAVRWQSLNEGFAIMPRRTWRLLSMQGVPMRPIGRFSQGIVVSRH